MPLKRQAKVASTRQPARARNVSHKTVEAAPPPKTSKKSLSTSQTSSFDLDGPLPPIRPANIKADQEMDLIEKTFNQLANNGIVDRASGLPAIKGRVVHAIYGDDTVDKMEDCIVKHKYRKDDEDQDHPDEDINPLVWYFAHTHDGRIHVAIERLSKLPPFVQDQLCECEIAEIVQDSYHERSTLVESFAQGKATRNAKRKQEDIIGEEANEERDAAEERVPNKRSRKNTEASNSPHLSSPKRRSSRLADKNGDSSGVDGVFNTIMPGPSDVQFTTSSSARVQGQNTRKSSELGEQFLQQAVVGLEDTVFGANYTYRASMRAHAPATLKALEKMANTDSQDGFDMEDGAQESFEQERVGQDSVSNVQSETTDSIAAAGISSLAETSATTSSEPETHSGQDSVTEDISLAHPGYLFVLHARDRVVFEQWVPPTTPQEDIVEDTPPSDAWRPEPGYLFVLHARERVVFEQWVPPTAPQESTVATTAAAIDIESA